MPQAAFYWQIGVTKLQKQRDWAKSSASQPYGTVRAIPAIVYMHPYDLALLERIWREVYNHQFEMGSWMLEEDLGPKNRLQMQDPRDSKRSLQTHCVFPTCQVRVVRFYVSCLLLPRPPLVLLSSSSSPPRPPRPPCHPCRPLVVLLVSLSSSSSCSTATRDPQCSLPDLNHDHPRPVFPAGPQPRPSTPSVPCRTSTASIHAKCSLPDLMRYAR